ncbi:hypothetical protein CASFOL_006230 [Castilleja foliolosa]|uniref:SWIM-type domain-containing protein n=1 Tax=Castilleja foliolosa TaxID=1961234 RepID=A0ABD3E6D7_9LAMI
MSESNIFIDDDEHEILTDPNCVNVIFYVSPGNTQYYTPECAPELKPKIDQRFPTLEAGIDFYRKYATTCGFDTRLGTTVKKDGVFIWRYVTCNREGEKFIPVAKEGENIVENLESPKTPKFRASSRQNCKALIALKYCGVEGYVVKRFEETHSHPLCDEPFRQFMKVNRNLDAGHQNFILNCAKVNIGPVKSFRMYKEAVGGYANVGCTGVDFKNYSRDLKAFVSGVDAEMLLQNLCRKRETSPGFYFDYVVDQGDHLNRIFWADPTCRRSFDAFGDSVSFDATYSTNRYKMIFAPFTGKDNHDNIITFGAGLLSNEDVDSYSWLFEKFKHCMGRSPSMLVTDEDPSMKKAVPRVFEGTRHRFCMWHITNKIPTKVPPRLRNHSDFMRKFNRYIWDEQIEPTEFEKGWDEVMTEFGVKDHDWLGKMFDARYKWIPAYFRDFPLSGLVKTTSISESVNSFFGRYLNKNSNLIEFFSQYDSALEAQRHTQDLQNNRVATIVPELKTPMPIERHALRIYSQKIFLDVQADIAASLYKCHVIAIDTNSPISSYKVEDDVRRIFDVNYNMDEQTYACSCKKFIRIGLVCSHIFVIFKINKVDNIPDKYIVNRWTRDPTRNQEFNFGTKATEKCVAVTKGNLMKNTAYSEFYGCMGSIDGDPDKMAGFVNHIREYRALVDADSDSPTEKVPAKRRLFEDYYKSQKPVAGSGIKPPLQAKNKGSGAGGRRLKSFREEAIQQSNKPLRLCRKCNQKTNHDSRNCDKVTEGTTS